LSSQEPEVDLEVAKQILRYFERNPEAADTLEGVARWRLLEELILSRLETVSRAVTWLVSEQLLVKESSTFAPPVFRLNTSALVKIETFLHSKH